MPRSDARCTCSHFSTTAVDWAHVLHGIVNRPCATMVGLTKRESLQVQKCDIGHLRPLYYYYYYYYYDYYYPLMNFTESICHSIDNNKYGCGVFIDLKESFWYCKSFWVFFLKLHHYMEWEARSMIAINPIYLAENMQFYLSMHGHLEPMVSLKDLFLDLCYLCYMSMFYQTFQKRWLFFYLLIISFI